MRNLFPGLVSPRSPAASTIMQPSTHAAAVERGKRAMESSGTIATEDGVCALGRFGAVQRVAWVAKLDGSVSPRSGCLAPPKRLPDGGRGTRSRSRQGLRSAHEHCVVREAPGQEDGDTKEELEESEELDVDTYCDDIFQEVAALHAAEAAHDDWWAWYENEKRRRRVEQAEEAEEEEKARERAAIQREADDRAAGEALRVELEQRRHARKMEAQRVEQMAAAQKREMVEARKQARKSQEQLQAAAPNSRDRDI